MLYYTDKGLILGRGREDGAKMKMNIVNEDGMDLNQHFTKLCHYQ